MKLIATIDGAKIYETRLVWPGTSGWTLGERVFIKPKLDESHRKRLVAHELVHVEQYRKHGIVGFLKQYFTDYAKNLVTCRKHRQAYLDIPFEIEARDATNWGDGWQARSFQ